MFVLCISVVLHLQNIFCVLYCYFNVKEVKMDDMVDVEINGRDLKISLRVLEKLQFIANESRKRGMDPLRT